MRKLIILTAAILVLGSIPATTAKHLSAGVHDGAGLSPDETPNNPSVEGDVVGADDTPFGIATQKECYDPEGNVSPEEAQAAVNADSLCGELVYHNDTPIEVTSRPDQDILSDEISSFDVIHTRSYRTQTYTGVAADVLGAELGGFSYCAPMCPPDSALNPAGDDVVFNQTHNAAAQLDLTEDADDAREGEPEDRGQHYAFNTYVRGPGTLVQEETNLWNMNGWMVPHIENTFIAYPEDDEGNIITEQKLDEIVSAESGDLHPDTATRICAYSPDIELTTVAPGAAGTRCELPFRFRGEPQEDNDGAMFDGYDDRCKSPAYVCGSVNGPAWYAEFCLCFGFTNPNIPGTTPLLGFDNFFVGDAGSQTDYLRWHHIIAPHDSACGGAQEPTAELRPSSGANHEKPYLAHDLDIYVPAWTLNNAPQTRGTQHALDYTDEAVDEGVRTALGTVDDLGGLLSGLPTVPDEVAGAASDAQNASTLVSKGATMEPNNAIPVGGLDDTSRQVEDGDQLVRDFEAFCEEFLSNEDSETIDPWVDYIDSQAIPQTTGVIPQATGVGPYNTADQDQDSTNRPGPNVYATSGNVGMFTDKDDDGAYEPSDGGMKYEGKTVQEEGAYPMIWDMVVEDDGTPDLDGGCAPSDGVNLVKAMTDLGYGANTGMVQAIFMNEPAAFIDPASGETISYEDGQNIYLLMSQAARQKYLAEEDPIKSNVDDLVTSVGKYAASERDDLGESDIGVELPAQELGFPMGFEHQCNGSSGNFDSRVQFTHSCQLDCTGDTIATMYTFELDDGQLQGAPLLPGFFASGDTAYDFGDGQHQWYDIDPFDNDPDRNEERQDPPAS